ncbi:MAG: HAMP domain-containing histidine kinase [Acidimicrobiia bacterium]|nr:HAMP domain-containing histidine kinase [Acidimicrobiia bacterium]
MSRGHWGGQWGPPKGSGGQGNWEFRPGQQAWQGFGRKFFFGMIFFFGFMAFVVWVAFKIISAIVSSGWAALAVVVVLCVFAVSGARTLRPVRRLIDAAGKLADGDYSVRVNAAGSASSRRVVRSFNSMAERLESADEQRRQLLADLGHELRTPLTVVRGEIEAMVDGVHAPDPEHLQQLLDEVAVMERLLEDLRTLSMAEAGALALHVEPTDLSALIADAVESHSRTADSQAVAIAIDTDDVGEVLVDPVRVKEVISNLTVNALRAMPDGGALRVAVRRDGSDALILIKDTGVGIHDEDLDAVFERFRKGSTSAGSGLGLTISRDLVDAHGGTIDIRSEVGVGTTVEVRLPMRRVQ